MPLKIYKLSMTDLKSKNYRAAAFSKTESPPVDPHADELLIAVLKKLFHK